MFKKKRGSHHTSSNLKKRKHTMHMYAHTHMCIHSHTTIQEGKKECGEGGIEEERGERQENTT